MNTHPACHDLRDFIARLEAAGELRRIAEPVSPHLEMTALSDRVLRAGGPALLFENPAGHAMPVLTNLFGTPARVARALGVADLAGVRALGEVLAQLKEPEPPRGVKGLWGQRDLLKTLWRMAPATVRQPPCQLVVWAGDEVDLRRLPIQHCGPGDVAPLVTWGLTITRGPLKTRQNLGVYRQQLLSRNQLILRWLAHRGGALDFAEHCARHPGQPYPVAVAIGADPATILGAVTPVPDTLSEYQFAGLLRGARTEVAPALSVPLQVPARAEIVLEGHIQPDAGHASGWQHAWEGPYGDHTGYYNERAEFPVLTVDRITLREGALYHSTHTGKPPDEPAVLGGVLNELFVPLLQRAFPEIVDFYLPPRGLQLPHGRGAHPQGLRRPRAARDDGRVEPPAPVPLHQVHRGGGRGRGRARMARGDLGHEHPHGPGARHPADRAHPHRLPGLRLARGRPGQQDGAGRHPQVARRDPARMGPPAGDGPGREHAREPAGRRPGVVASACPWRRDEQFSHDHCFHSTLGLLGLLGVRTAVYDPARDIHAGCHA